MSARYRMGSNPPVPNARTAELYRLADYDPPPRLLPVRGSATVIILPVVRVESYDPFLDDPPPHRRRWPRR